MEPIELEIVPVGNSFELREFHLKTNGVRVLASAHYLRNLYDAQKMMDDVRRSIWWTPAVRAYVHRVCAQRSPAEHPHRQYCKNCGHLLYHAHHHGWLHFARHRSHCLAHGCACTKPELERGVFR